jgi:hypothetical protein
MDKSVTKLSSEIRAFAVVLLQSTPPQLPPKVKNWSEDVIDAEAFRLSRGDVRDIVD